MQKNNEAVGIRTNGGVNRLFTQFYNNQRIRKDLGAHKKFTIYNSRTMLHLQYLALTSSSKRKTNALIATKITNSASYGHYKMKDMPLSLRYAIKSVVPKGSKLMIKPDHNVILSDHLLRMEKKDIIGRPPVSKTMYKPPIAFSYSEGFNQNLFDRKDYNKLYFNENKNETFKISEIFTGVKVFKRRVIFMKTEIESLLTENCKFNIRVPIHRYPYVEHTHCSKLYFKLYLGDHRLVY